MKDTHRFEAFFLAFAIAFVIVAPLASDQSAYGQSGFNGTWVTTDFKNLEGTPETNYLNFRVDGNKVIGTVSRQDVFTIRDGAVHGDTVTFSAVSPDGERTISFVGKLDGDRIAFTRSVTVHDESGNRGGGILGAKAPKQFTAKLDGSASTGLEAEYGNWRLNLAKSHYEPNRLSQPVVPDILAIGAVGDGKAELIDMGANPLGNPTFAQTTFKTDGNDYPIYNEMAFDTILAGGKPTVRTNSMKVIDANTMEVTFKNKNVAYAVLTQVVSQDRQTLTATEKAIDPSGKQTVTSVEVYERIP